MGHQRPKVADVPIPCSTSHSKANCTNHLLHVKQWGLHIFSERCEVYPKIGTLASQFSMKTSEIAETIAPAPLLT